MRKYSFLFQIAWAVGGLLIFCHSAAAAQKAILIGIGHYKNLPYVNSQGQKLDNLRGPVNDVKQLKEALISQGHFMPEDILVLTDQEATREAILKNFNQWLVQETKPGDLALVYFSGHGTRVPNGKDGFYKALCPFDVQPKAKNLQDANLILDGELGDLLRGLKGREVVVIMDSCHAGGMTRSVKGVSASQLEETPAVQAKFLPMEVTEFNNDEKSRGGGWSDSASRMVDGPEDRIFLASSKEDQASLELALPSGVVHGAFTAALLEGLAKRKTLSYEEWFDGAQKTVKDKFRLEQDPQLKTNQNKMLSYAVFGPKFPAALPPVAASKNHQPAPLPIASTVPYELKDEVKVLVRLDSMGGSFPEALVKFQKGLQEIPYVEFVKTDIFDYLIRGEFKNNRYQIRLVTPMGDRKPIPPSKDMAEVLKWITPHLEYVHLLKQLSRISNPNPPFKVNVRVIDKDRRDFRVGEKARFLVFSDKDCYLIMLNLDSQGGMRILFPNQYYPNNFIKAGQVIKIPDEKMDKKFELEFGEPVGEEVVKVIASEKPLRLEDLGLAKPEESDRPKKTEPPTKLNLAKLAFGPKGFIEVPEGTRGIMVKKVETLSNEKISWSEDTIVIRTHH